MTDDGPRIFRTLEKTDGRDSFDAIVRASVSTFAALTRPTQRQALEFGRLVLPLFDRTNDETRVILATTLASAPMLPRDLVERLLAEPTSVAAPFLAASPLLTPADLATLGKRRDAATKRLLKARSAPVEAASPAKRKRTKPAADPGLSAEAPVEPVAAATTRSRPSSARQTALLSTGTPDRPAPSSPREEPVTPMPATAAETRDLLRQLATVGRREPAKAPPKPAEADLLSLALAGEAAEFHELLAAKLLLDRDRTTMIESDETGRELAAALKALDTGKADAMTMLMMLKPAIGSNVAGFEAMERIYETLDIDACRMRFPIGPGAFTETPKHRPLYAETHAPIRPDARSTPFGRRTSIPSESGRKKRGA